MKHLNPFRHGNTDAEPSANSTLRWLAILKVVVLGLIVLAIAALHVAGIVGLGLHAW